MKLRFIGLPLPGSLPDGRYALVYRQGDFCLSQVVFLAGKGVNMACAVSTLFFLGVYLQHSFHQVLFFLRGIAKM